MKLKNYYYLDTVEHFGDVIKGDIGQKGYKGFTGDTGSTGLKGLSGAIGHDGLRGVKGIQGKRGNKGDIGDPGNPGTPGLKGIKGIKGNIGPSGDKGPPGPRGPRGLIGPRGDIGKEGKEGLMGPKGESGKSFSTNKIDNNTTCNNWIQVPRTESPPNISYCPNNSALAGIRTRMWIVKVEQQVEECYCKRRGVSCWFRCCQKCNWKVKNALTTWQVNKSYEICCAPMPFDSSGQINKTSSDDELIDPYFSNAGSEDPSSPLYGLSPEQIKDKSLKNYPFHMPA